MSIAIAIGVVWLFPREDVIRGLGLIFEAAGLWTTARGVMQTREHFGLPGVRGIVSRSLSRFPPYRRHYRLVVGAGHITIGGAAGFGRVETRVSANATVDEKLEELKADLRELREDLASAQKKLDQEISTNSEKLDQEIRDRQEQNTDIRELVSKIETGGMSVTLLGLFWIGQGILMSTGSVELANLMQCGFLSCRPEAPVLVELAR